VGAPLAPPMVQLCCVGTTVLAPGIHRLRTQAPGSKTGKGVERPEADNYY
jgi:hypothetical protein